MSERTELRVIIGCALGAVLCLGIACFDITSISSSGVAGPSASPSPVGGGACEVGKVSVSGASSIPLAETRFYVADLATAQGVGLPESCAGGKTFVWSVAGPCTRFGPSVQRVEVRGDAAGTCAIRACVDGRCSEDTSVAVQP